MKILLSTTLLILLALCAPASALTTYSHSYTNVTSATITNAQHGFGSYWLGLYAKTSGGVVLNPATDISWTIDESTYEVDITFTNSFTGTVYLIGVWPSTDTGAGTDFKVDIGGNTANLYDCEQCATYPAVDTYGGQRYAKSEPSALSWVSFTASTVYVYGIGSRIHFGLSQATCNANQYNVTNAVVDCNVNSMPSSGVVPLGTASISSGAFTSVTDNRPSGW